MFIEIYRCTIESVLVFSICVWSGGMLAQQRRRLDRVVEDGGDDRQLLDSSTSDDLQALAALPSSKDCLWRSAPMLTACLRCYSQEDVLPPLEPRPLGSGVPCKPPELWRHALNNSTWTASLLWSKGWSQTAYKTYNSVYIRLLQPGTQAADGGDVSIEALSGLHGTTPKLLLQHPGGLMSDTSVTESRVQFPTSDGIASSSSSHQVLSGVTKAASLHWRLLLACLPIPLGQARPGIWCTRPLHLEMAILQKALAPKTMIDSCMLYRPGVRCSWFACTVQRSTSAVAGRLVNCWCALCLKKITVLSIANHSSNPDTESPPACTGFGFRFTKDGTQQSQLMLLYCWKQDRYTSRCLWTRVKSLEAIRSTVRSLAFLDAPTISRVSNLP